MTTLAETAPGSHPYTDSFTMLRREARRSLRNPMTTISGVATPIAMMLLFVGMFGDVMSAQLGSPKGGYVGYLAPGVVLMGLGSSVATTAISLNVDKSEGIISRFRTMPIARMAFLNGTAVTAALRSVISAVLVLGAAIALGFRSSAGLGSWLAALGLVTVVAIAFTWLGIAFGLLASSPAGANSLSLIGTFLPLLSSGFVPVERMPHGIRWFAEHQPFTPFIDTLRALVTDQPVGGTWVAAVAWGVGIAVVCFVWARRLFTRQQPSQGGGSVAQLMSH